MQQEKTDFTLGFRRLSDLVNAETASGGGVGAIFEFPKSFAPWLDRWRQKLTGSQAEMYLANPVFIPRNHLVEEAIVAAETQQDFTPFHKLVDILTQPFEYQNTLERYATPPRPEQVVQQTFCGT